MSDGNVSTPGVDTTAPAPIVHGRPVEVASGVFVVPDGRVPLVPNIGVIVGDRAALVVDSGLGPRNGAIAYQIAHELAGDRPILLTLTHFHPEHGFGAQAFADATILYNRSQHEEFRQKAEGYLTQFREFGGAIARELEGVEFVDPRIVYEGNADLDLGGRRVHLRTWGAAHSRGDQVIFLPDERILFTGDLVENRFYPIFPYVPPYDVDVDGDNWIRVIEALHDLDPAIVVPGHGELGGADLLATTDEALKLLRSETKRLTGEGRSEDETIAILGPELQARYPDWDTSEPWRIATAVQTFRAQ